jgi:hypothetical protein
MAFPTVEEILTQGFSPETTSHSVDMPTTVNSGELLLVIIIAHCTSTTTPGIATPTNWEDLEYQEYPYIGINCGVYQKKASGDEGGTTVDFVTTNGSTVAAIILRVSNWGENTTSDIDVSISNLQFTSNPNPSSVTAGWGSDDNLFIAYACFTDDDATFIAAPTNYTNLTYVVSGGGSNYGCEVGVAFREYASSNDDPGTFTLSQSQSGWAGTIVIRPQQGTIIDATLGQLTITGNQATVLQGTAIDATLGQLTIAGQQASVLQGTTIDATCPTVTLTGLSAEIANWLVIHATCPNVELAGKQATVLQGTVVEATAGNLTIAGNQAGVYQGQAIDATVGQVTITGLSAEIWQNTVIEQINFPTVELVGKTATVEVVYPTYKRNNPRFLITIGLDTTKYVSSEDTYLNRS